MDFDEIDATCFAEVLDEDRREGFFIFYVAMPPAKEERSVAYLTTSSARSQ